MELGVRVSHFLLVCLFPMALSRILYIFNVRSIDSPWDQVEEPYSCPLTPIPVYTPSLEDIYPELFTPVTPMPTPRRSSSIIHSIASLHPDSGDNDYDPVNRLCGCQSGSGSDDEETGTTHPASTHTTWPCVFPLKSNCFILGIMALSSQTSVNVEFQSGSAGRAITSTNPAHPSSSDSANPRTQQTSEDEMRADECQRYGIFCGFCHVGCLCLTDTIPPSN